MAHRELNLRERRRIGDILNAKISVRKIATDICRHVSTVYREIKRNHYDDKELPELNGYYGVVAQRSLVERKTRYAVLFRNNDRSTNHLMNRLMGVMEPLPQPARKSITFDRGIEFRNWRKLKPGIGTEAWFCDPQAPWQKGSVENLNKRARRYLPRDAPVAALSNRDMKSICDRLNGTPRKCLGWRNPTEAFREELMKLR